MLNKNEAFFELFMQKDLSDYAKEKNKVERMFENQTRNSDSLEREIKAGHLMRVP